MLSVAVTGGIGAGKSTAARRLARLGAIVVDSDRLAREVVEPGTDGFDEVVAAFGPRVVGPDGSLDRAALAAVVFGDEAARTRLEGIIHPRVRAAFREVRDGASDDAVVVNDIPLVRTAAEAAQFHLVIAVGASDEVRLPRLIARGMTRSDATARIAAQIDDRQRRAISDVWLDNDGDQDALHRAVTHCWQQRLTPMAANIATATIAPRPDPALVPSDHRWPELAGLLAARVSAATGGLPCEHIGPTAVPGLPAPDVIDLQLAVPDLAAADAAAGDLARAGFPLRTGIDRDHPHPVDADPAGWAKRLHQNADPGRAVNLHLRVRGAPNWRWALLVRDWLRSEEGERNTYLALRRDGGGQHREVADDAEATEEWLRRADARMRRWAAATGWRPA